jgi:glyoxylase-like metal-dependent hydrolase (beta-lactamase superfamily II)
MELPIRLPGLGHVNCYALLDDDGATLVDPGLPGKATWTAIQQRLGQAGLRTKDIHTVFVTHSHPDHFGGAGKFAKEAGAKIVAHHSFSLSYGGNKKSHDDDHHEEAHAEASVDDIEVQLDAEAIDEAERVEAGELPKLPTPKWGKTTPWGGKTPKPSLWIQLKWRMMFLMNRGLVVPKVTDPVHHGDLLKIGRREWRVVHTPGHTQDHVCLHDPDRGIFLSGDHVLPSITPHISGLTQTLDPLQSFFDSLASVGEIGDIKIALPAHGHPFEDLKARTDAIKEHHFERLDKVKEIGAELGAATVEQYMQRLFKERSWGGMAASETFAHLEHLRLGGQADCHASDAGFLLYET